MPAQGLHRVKEGGTYLHIFNKGVESRTIFKDEDDFRVFLSFIEEYLSPPRDIASIKKEFSIHGRTFRGIPHQPKNYFGRIELLAYNIQPDHFHLLLHQKIQNSLQGFIRSLCTRYSMYFNKKYQHTGTLFEGPYKSVQIKDEAIPLLTRYLHKNGKYSSYAEYLRLKNTPWVETKIVLSINNNYGSYQDFVEKYSPDQKEEELLEKIIIEKIDNHLERRSLARNTEDYSPKIPTESSEKTYSDPNSNLKPFQRVPEITVVTLMFLVLVSVGMRNIMISTTTNPKPSALGVNTTVSTTKSLKPSPTPSISKTEEAKPKIMLTIAIDDASASANIRQKPTVNSKKIGKAKDGDTFELVSEDSQWYGIKLSDGIGFISAQYVKKGEEDN